MNLKQKRCCYSKCPGSPTIVSFFTGGAQINVIPITAFDTLAESRMKQLKPTKVRLTGYSGNIVPTTGTCRIECKLRDKQHTLEFVIADTHATPIIGDKTGFGR